jgi:hypothetical protein
MDETEEKKVEEKNAEGVQLPKWAKVLLSILLLGLLAAALVRGIFFK